MAAIDIESLSKRFGAVPVVDDINLCIAEGEFFTIVGPSGCGKSTLLSLIAGLESPSAGAIRFDNEPVSDLPAHARDVAMVFQSYALYPHMTVAENIGFPLKLRGAPRTQIAIAVAQVAAALGIELLLARRPRELSGGQRQRVALGRALVRRPRAFLMDEPLSNLDARLRLEMRAELKRLHATYGITTVYVTHDQEEAMALSDRIAVLDGGRVQQCDTPLRVYDDPHNLFVAGFIGSPPINVLAAVWRDGAAHPAPPGTAPESVIAIRPADIRVQAAADGPRLEAEVSLCEPTGSDLWVIGRWHGQPIVGRAAPGEAFTPGAKAHFAFAPERLYRFNRVSGARVRVER